jgi:hypothetical protein
MYLEDNTDNIPDLTALNLAEKLKSIQTEWIGTGTLFISDGIDIQRRVMQQLTNPASPCTIN